jgi:hypothetical protein
MSLAHSRGLQRQPENELKSGLMFWSLVNYNSHPSRTLSFYLQQPLPALNLSQVSCIWRVQEEEGGCHRNPSHHQMAGVDIASSSLDRREGRAAGTDDG